MEHHQIEKHNHPQAAKHNTLGSVDVQLFDVTDCEKKISFTYELTDFMECTKLRRIGVPTRGNFQTSDT